jgi:hypothetical protein
MAQQYQISQLFQAAFGVRAITFPEARNQAESANPNIDFSGLQVVSQDEAIQRSHLGTPIVMPITFKGGIYNIYSRRGSVEKQSVKDFRLPLSCIVDFTRAKIKTSTRVVGASASIKEMYGHEDWKVRIRGFCLAEPGHPQRAETPIEQHNRLLEFEKLADSIEVEGALFREKAIYRLDIDQIEWQQLVGKPDIMPFTMQCESDDPLELIINT